MVNRNPTAPRMGSAGGFSESATFNAPTGITHGQHFIPYIGTVLTGMRYYNAINSITPDIKLSLWRPNGDNTGTRIYTTTQLSVGVGWQTWTFPAPYVVTEADFQRTFASRGYWWWVTQWETTGTYFNEFYGGYITQYQNDRALWMPGTNTAWGKAGDVFPSDGQLALGNSPTEVIGYGVGEEFVETDPPVVQNQNPAPSSTGNRADAAIYAEVIDTGSGLNASTVQFWVNGVPAWSGGAASSGWGGTRAVVGDGYSYTFTPDDPILSGATNTVRVRALDNNGNVLDTTYTFDCGTFLDSVELEHGAISTVGGELVTLRGLWPIDRAVDVHLGPLGTVDDPLCYGGLGLGYEALSEDGVTLEVASPPLAKGAAGPTVVDGVTVVTAAAIEVVERSWPGKLHRARASFPPWKALGARKLGEEGLE